MVKRLGILAVTTALAMMAVWPGTATAATILGSTGTPANCNENYAYTSATVSAQPDFIADAPGVITSWSTRADADAGQTMKLIVLRPEPPPDLSTYAKVAESGVRPLPSPGALNVITGVRVPIKAGEYVGAFVPDGQPGDLGSCLTYTAAALDTYDHFGPGDPPLDPTGVMVGQYTRQEVFTRLNLSAAVEPDADGDGFGDETQDLCPADAGAQGVCPLPPTPPAALPPTPPAAVPAATGQRAAALKRCKKRKGKARKKCKKKAKQLPD